MKKSLIILLVLGVLLTLGLASCKNEVQVPSEELVSVSFEQAVSRALTATVQEFDKDDYFWYYAAAKTDSTGLISGQTAGYDYAHAVAVKSGKGLDGQVPGFSQGSWKFTLFAYGGDVAPTAEQMGSYVYSGEATAVTLKKNGANTVSVTVNPAEQGQGTLFIDMANIKLSEASSASHNTVAPQVSITKTKDAQTFEMVPGTNIEYTADAGQWTVKVDYTDGDIIFATGTVIATVYPGLKTTVSGDVSELITYAQFDAIENPDLVKVTAGSTATAYDDIPAAGVVLSGTKETKTVKTTVAATDAQTIMTEMATNAGADLSADTTTMALALNVDPTAATEKSITYDISMSATLTVNAGTEAAKSTVKDVETLANAVTVEISMQKDLQDVEVYHKTTKMTRVDSKNDLADGKFYYDAENGKLYICTSTFSPFSISYKFIEYAASLNGKKYETLVEAFTKAVESEKKSTIYLLKDASGKGIFLAQNLGADITVDLCGYTYTCTGPAVGSTGTQTQAWHLEKNNKVTIKNGKIDCTSDAGVIMLVQNYCDLTLQDVAVDGTKLPGTGRYVLSGNNGDILITGKTDITAKTGDYAFDVCYTGYYPDGVRYVFDENYTGTVTGTIQFDVWGTLPATTYCSLTIKAGTFTGEFDIEEALRDRAKDDIHISGGSFGDYVAFGFNANKMYSSLTDAIDEAKSTTNTDKVLLLKDVQMGKLSSSENVAVSVKKNLILDGCSHTLYTTAGRGIWVAANDVSLKIENLTVKGSALERAVQVNTNVTGVNLVIDNCELTSTMYAINYCNYTTGNTVITNSKVTGWGALNVWSNGNSIEATDCTFIGINDKGYDAAGWNNFGTIVLEADTTGQTAHGASGMQITLTRCNIIGMVTTGNKQYLILFNHNCEEGAYGNSVLATSCAFGYVIEDGTCEVSRDGGTGNTFTAVNCTLNGEPYSKN